MDQKTLSQILDTVAAQHTPADLDMLPDIQARLKKSRSFIPLLQQRPARLIASVVVCLLVVVTTVYAAQLLIRDPGLQETMVTPLNLSMTKGDVTITLDWAYADANRIKLAYTVSSPTQEIVKRWVNNMELTDRRTPGKRVELHGYGLIYIDKASPYSYQVEANFDPRELENPTDVIDLRLRIMGNYFFDFSVPFNPAIRIERQPDVAAAGLNANVEWAIITPSMTRAYICYETPDETMWVADVLLAYDGELVAQEPEASGWGAGPYNGPQERWCVERSFLTSYDTLPNELTFTIRAIQTPTHYTEEDMQRASEVFATYGIQTEAVPGNSEPEASYTLKWLSPAPGYEEYNRIWLEAVAAMGDGVRWERIEGPWTLTVQLP